MRFCAFNHPGKTLQLFVARQVRTCVKSATSLFNSFCRNVTKQAGPFLLPVLSHRYPLFFTKIGKEDKRPIILPFYVDLRFLNPPPPPYPLESDCVKEVILLTRFSDTEVTERFYLWAGRERSLAIPRSTKLHSSAG